MDAWVEAEIERQLQEISVGEAEELADGNGGEELGHTEGSQLIGHSQPVAMPSVSDLFQGYLQALSSQHQTAKSVATDTEGTLAAANQTLSLKIEDLLPKHFADEWEEGLQSTLESKDEVLAKLELQLLASEDDAAGTPNEETQSDEMMIGAPISPSVLMTETSPLATLQPCTATEESSDTTCGQTGDERLKTMISYRNTDWQSESDPEGETAQADICEAAEQYQESVSQENADTPSNQTPENSATAPEDVTTLTSEPSLGTRNSGDEVGLRSPSAANAMETSQQTIVAQERELQVPLHAAIAELEAEQRRWEEELRREQQEREAAINAMIAESEQLRVEREKLLQERAAEEQLKRTRAATVLRAHWKGHHDRCRYGPQLEAMRTRRLQEEEERTLAAQRLTERRHNAARVMQAHWRGYRCRKEVLPVLQERKEAKRVKQLTATTMDGSHADQPSTPIATPITTPTATPQPGSENWLSTPTDTIQCPPGQSRDSLPAHIGEPGAIAHLSAKEDSSGDLLMSQSRGEQQKIVSTSHELTATDAMLEQENADSDPSVFSQSGDSQPMSKTPPNTADSHSENSTLCETSAVGLFHIGTTAGKFTVSKRIKSALKLRQQEEHCSRSFRAALTGDATSDCKKPRSVSLPEDSRTGTGHGSTGMQTPGMRIEPRLGLGIGMNLKAAEKSALAGEISRVQRQDDDRTRHFGEGKSPRERLAKFQIEPSSANGVPSASGSPSKRTDIQSPLRSSSSMSSQASPEKVKRRKELSKSSVKPPEVNSLSLGSEAVEKLATPGSKPVGKQETKLHGKQENKAALNQNDEAVKAASSKAVTEEGGDLVRQQQAMAALMESREREEMAAQLSRDRMSKMASAEQLAQAAKARRSHSTYQRQLEHASTPLSPQAWVGVVGERLQQWRDHRTTWTEPVFGSRPQPLKPSAPSLVPRSTAHSRPLSDAQLLSASPRGTKLEQVTQVVAYRSRAPIDQACLSKCPHLHSLSLMQCRVTTLFGITGCPQLLEMSMSSNAMEGTDLSNLPQLRFLDLSDNRLASIHGLGHCSALLELNLAENRIARVGTGVSGCPRLQKVVLDGNLIINCKGLQDLSLLQHFSCTENHLPRMDSLDGCCLLQTLRASQNNIQELPPLKNFVLLRELTLDENSLSEITTISQAWLPLLQTLSLANNCITELQSLTSLLMLETLDVSNNSLYDLPDLLQCIRGCFVLKSLAIQGNPVTEEPKFRTHILKVLPSLQQLDSKDIRRTGAPKLNDAVTSSEVYQLCRRQLSEQDGMRERHLQELEGSEEAASPEKIAHLCNLKVSHCMEYQQLLIGHLREHEGLVIEGTDSRSRRGGTKRHSATQRSSAELRSRAAVIIQSAWRGWKTRQLLWQWRRAASSIQRCWREYCAQKLRKMHSAATVIQAHYRGYRLRRRWQEVLSSARYVEEEGEGEGEERDLFNYEEEITLDCVDEISFSSLPSLGVQSLLEGDLKPLSPKSPLYGTPVFLLESQLPPTLPPKPRPVMVPSSYVLPGAVESEVPLETWRQQQQKLRNPRQAYHIQHPFRENKGRPPHPVEYGPADTETPQDYHLPGELGSLRVTERDSSHSRPSQPKTQFAWGSVTELPEVHDSQRTPTLAPSESEAGVSHHEAGARLKEQIADEWGFKSSATAELMLKRAQRQRKLQANATRRKKLADPTERLAVFRKMKDSDRREEGRPRAVRGAPRVDYFRAPSSVKSSPSPDPEDTQAKEDFLYHWVHEQHVVHQHNLEEAGGRRREAGPRELLLSGGARRQAKKKWHPTGSLPAAGHSSSLPPIEPHILAGHAPRLVSSEAQNQIVDINLQPQRTEADRQQLRAQSMQGTDFTRHGQGRSTDFQTSIGSHSVPTIKWSFKK